MTKFFNSEVIKTHNEWNTFESYDKHGKWAYVLELLAGNSGVLVVLKSASIFLESCHPSIIKDIVLNGVRKIRLKC